MHSAFYILKTSFIKSLMKDFIKYTFFIRLYKEELATYNSVVSMTTCNWSKEIEFSLTFSKTLLNCSISLR